MIRTLKIFIAITVIFLLHRYYGWQFLTEQFSSRSIPVWKEVFVGVLSDIWIAGLLTLPFWIFEYIRTAKSDRLQRRVGFFYVILIGSLTAGHQSYVEFFKFQIIPFHLSYLVDVSFLKSNSSSVLDPAPTIIMIATVAIAYWTRRATQVVSKSALNVMFLSMFTVITVGHALNIRWRVNWYIVEPLQTNYMETLFANLAKKPTMKALSQEEKDSFEKLTGNENWLWVQSTKVASSTPSLRILRSTIRTQASLKKPVILGLVLAESLRSSDVGPRPKDGKSLTPFLDRLQESGVRFANVYSSGPVTRGGQEATWCGTPSATDTSLMRSYPDLDVKCLPKMFRDRADVTSMWVHGGDERFDSQLMFWSHQGVNRFVTKSDFSDAAPSTSWGISDLAVFEKSAATLADLASSGKYSIILPMILTVTNHIPWAIPDDASIETKSFLAHHPAQRTIKYFDESLGLFVAALKEKDLWSNSLFIVAGDHGNLEPAWRDDYAGDPLKWERLLSHVSVTLTGGIVEQLRQNGQLPADINQHTAQSQIASFLHYLASSNGNEKSRDTLWDAPMFTESPWVISSDLNQYLFLPADNVRLDKEDVLAGNVPREQTRAWLASVRYRGWLEFLYSSKSSH